MLASGLICASLTLYGAGAETPAGRPPTGPLERFEPRVYDVRFEVSLWTVMQRLGQYRENYDLKDAPIVMPVVFQSTFSRVAPDSLRGSLWLSNREADVAGTTRIDATGPFDSHVFIIPIQQYQGQTIRWGVEYRVEVWSSRLKDEAAAAVAWPERWPDEVKDGLKPQMFIESGDPVFAQAVEKISQGQLRAVPVWLAAKDLVRAVINDFRPSGIDINWGERGELQGIHMVGARQTMADGQGGPHDLVCVCVAILRAAGIPARPVVGLERDPQHRWIFVSWAELYLPGAGWVPFDPVVMRAKGLRHRDVHDPWPEFGTMEDLNRRIPLAFGYLPASTVSVPENPAVWGWDPRPGNDPSSDQAINITVTSRGKGTDQPDQPDSEQR